ncbi:baseplate J/gp47 family protein [Pseudomonas sp. NPDC089554]|uniref:baseplate J/gp47 family protein n=1 Tax=Pseudomonas sp. NPDC089554 TaxID=3390653 RepID=UPI003CFD6216
MAISIPAFENILGQILRDIRNLQSEADIGKDSDNYARSAAFSAAVEGVYQKLAWIYRQIFADTSDEDELLHHAAIRGMFQKVAVAATGQVLLTGTPGATLLQGATIKHVATGETFTAISSAEVGTDRSVIVAVRANTVGVSLNGLSNELVVTSPPLGMSPSARFVSETTGGEDAETMESLLTRYLDIVQAPPAGGAVHDYRRWAREVDGVVDALVLPRRRGGGTVDIVITASDGAPSAEVIANCLAHIQSQCSVIADIWVYAPAIREVDATALVELAPGFLLVDVQREARKGYDSLLGGLKPREILKRSQIEAMLNNLAGVIDRAVQAPANNVKASDDDNVVGWIRPGSITLGLLE